MFQKLGMSGNTKKNAEMTMPAQPKARILRSPSRRAVRAAHAET